MALVLPSFFTAAPSSGCSTKRPVGRAFSGAACRCELPVGALPSDDPSSGMRALSLRNCGHSALGQHAGGLSGTACRSSTDLLARCALDQLLARRGLAVAVRALFGGVGAVGLLLHRVDGADGFLSGLQACCDTRLAPSHSGRLLPLAFGVLLSWLTDTAGCTRRAPWTWLRPLTGQSDR